jgi:hypothetical protein
MLVNPQDQQKKDFMGSLANSLQGGTSNYELGEPDGQSTAIQEIPEGTSFNDELIKIMQNNVIADFPFKNEDFAQTFQFDTVKIDRDDAQFFIDVLEQNKIVQVSENVIPTTANLMPNITTNAQEEKSVKATQKIMEMLEIAQTKNKPIRIDFDNNITVVLKTNKEGKINAQFYPNDKIAEEYLKNNIQSLRQTFDDKKIPYVQLDYKQSKQQNSRQQKEKQQ